MVLQLLKRWTLTLKQYLYTVYLAARDSRVPLPAKLAAGITIAYALSPIDLIPDFIPVFGYLDDLVLIPIGIYLVVRLVPGKLWSELSQSAIKQEPKTIVSALKWAGITL